jgi:hypothetical protein
MRRLVRGTGASSRAPTDPLSSWLCEGAVEWLPYRATILLSKEKRQKLPDEV